MEFGKTIHIISKKLKKNHNENVEELGLTASQARVIAFLFRNKKNKIVQNDIKEHFDFKASSINGLLVKLENNNFIKRLTILDDKRCKQIILTEKGKNIGKRVIDSIINNEKISLKGFSDEEKKLYFDFLDRTIKNIEGKKYNG